MTRAAPLRELLRSHRAAGGLTLEALAELSGVSDRTISDIERGVSTSPRSATMAALASALGLSGESRDELLTAARAGRVATATRSRRDDMEPHRLADFNGRGEELARVTAILREHPHAGAAAPLVVLSGAPGVGKTTIAVEIAHRQSDTAQARLFVDLGGLDEVPLSPLQVLQSLLRQLRGDQEETSTLPEARDAWAAATARAPVAVVLDDAASESQVRPVLSADNRSKILVTSRRTLAGLEGARHLYIRVLPRGESTALLGAIIPAGQVGDGDLDELADLCGDLPLALRIASLRIASQPLWTVEDYARRLRAEGRRLDTLVAGDIGVNATFSTSYNTLPKSTRDLFRHLALLNGSTFGAPMAGAILGLAEIPALDLLDELADLGLVEVLHGERYRLHDLLRLYAGERLHAEVTPEALAGAVRRLGRWTLDSAANAGDMFSPDAPDAASQRPGGQRFETPHAARRWLEAETDYWFAEYRRAAGEGRHPEVLAVAPSITWFGDRWIQWGRWYEFFDIAASSASATGNREAEAEALNNLAYMQVHELFDFEGAEATAQRALAIATADANPRQQAWALTHLSGSRRHRTAVESILVPAREAVAIFMALGDLEGELQPRGTIIAALLDSDPEAALGDIDRLIDITMDASAALSDDFRYGSRMNFLTMKGKVLLRLERFTEALQLAEALLDFANHSDFATNGDRSRALRHRGFAHLGLGHRAEAVRDLEATLALAGTQRPQWWADEITEALDSLRASGPERFARGTGADTAGVPTAAPVATATGPASTP